MTFGEYTVLLDQVRLLSDRAIDRLVDEIIFSRRVEAIAIGNSIVLFRDDYDPDVDGIDSEVPNYCGVDSDRLFEYMLSHRLVFSIVYSDELVHIKCGDVMVLGTIAKFSRALAQAVLLSHARSNVTHTPDRELTCPIEYNLTFV